MSHIRLLERLVNTPLAINQGKLDILTVAISQKLAAGIPLQALSEEEKIKVGGVTEKEGFKVIDVHGALAAKGFPGDSGITSYQSLTKNIKTAISEGWNNILLNIDSPGGELASLFEFTDFIHGLVKQGVNISSFISGYGTSAAYAIAAATNQIYASDTSVSGSIAVIASLMNVSKADEKMGIDYKILRSKSEKALLNPHEPFTEKAINDLEALLAKYDDIFNARINIYRPNLSIDKINSFKGNSFISEEALNLGLIDTIVSGESDVLFSLINKGKAMNEIDKLKAENAELQTKLKAMQEAGVQAVAAERTRVIQILEAGEKLHIKSAIIEKRIKAGTSSEDAISSFEDLVEAMQEQNPIPKGKQDSVDISKKTEDSGISAMVQSLLQANEKFSMGGIK